MRREPSAGCILGKVSFAGTFTFGSGRTAWPNPVNSGATVQFTPLVQKVFAEVVKLDTKPTALARSKLTANCSPYWSFVIRKPPRITDSSWLPKTFDRKPLLNFGDQATARLGWKLFLSQS